MSKISRILRIVKKIRRRGSCSKARKALKETEEVVRKTIPDAIETLNEGALELGALTTLLKTAQSICPAWITIDKSFLKGFLTSMLTFLFWALLAQVRRLLASIWWHSI